MSKTIKVDDQVYDHLEGFREKGETFSQAVARLLEIRNKLRMLTDILEGQRESAQKTARQLHDDSKLVPDRSSYPL